VGMGWDLLAAGVVANDGAKPGSASVLKNQGLEVHFSSAPAEGVENALARGGADERGADVAILPLPRFVASYDQLRALDPVIFMVVAWSEGREAVFVKGKTLEVPAAGDVKLRADVGSVQAFLGLFALDVSGVALDRVKLVAKPADAWDLAVQTKRASDGAQPSGTLLFGTSEASRLVPVVAIAQASLLAKSERAVVAFGSGWLEGERLVAADAAGAARKVATEQGAPEPLAVLAGLGELGPASLGENAGALGLSGRSANSVEKLFTRTWDLFRGAKLLGVPPERAPVDGRIVAALVRAGGALAPPASSTPRKDRPAQGGALLVHRAPKGKLDEDALLEVVGLLAATFPRAPVEVTVHGPGGVDKKATPALIARAEERYGLVKGRIVAGDARSKDGAAATVELLPVP